MKITVMQNKKSKGKKAILGTVKEEVEVEEEVEVDTTIEE